jgi:hypothetical protein
MQCVFFFYVYTVGMASSQPKSESVSTLSKKDVCDPQPVKLSLPPDTTVTAKHPGPIAEALRRDRLRITNTKLRQENATLRHLITDLYFTHPVGSSLSYPSSSLVHRFPMMIQGDPITTGMVRRRMGVEMKKMKESEAALRTLQLKISRLKVNMQEVTSTIAQLEQQLQVIGPSQDVGALQLDTNRRIAALRSLIGTGQYPAPAIRQQYKTILQSYTLEAQQSKQNAQTRASLEQQLRGQRTLAQALETQLQSSTSEMQKVEQETRLLQQQLAAYKAQLPSQRMSQSSSSTSRWRSRRRQSGLVKKKKKA